MKKTYIQPSQEVINLSNDNLIMTSIGISEDGADQNYTGGGDVKEETWGNMW